MRRAAAALLMCLSLVAGCTAGGGDDDDDQVAGPDAMAGDPEETGPDGGAAGACMGGTPFLEACTDSDACDTCLCFTYGMGAKLCSHECSRDEDCAAPSTGCNGMGVCKRPGG